MHPGNVPYGCQSKESVTLASRTPTHKIQNMMRCQKLSSLSAATLLVDFLSNWLYLRQIDRQQRDYEGSVQTHLWVYRDSACLWFYMVHIIITPSTWQRRFALPGNNTRMTETGIMNKITSPAAQHAVISTTYCDILIAR